MAAARHPTPAAAAGDISDEQAAGLWATFLAGANPASFAAFDRLYAAFLPLAVRYCRSRLPDDHQAEDVANTAFVRLLETRPAIKSSFTGLLLRTVRNACTSELSRKPPVDPALVDPPARSADPPGQELERRDEHDALAECLDQLTEPDRTLVVLYHGEGLTYGQIADALGLRAAISTLSKRLKRIKTQLLGCLKKKNIF